MNNLKKVFLKTKLMEIAIAGGAIAIMPKLIEIATAERGGVKAYGGEYAVPVIAFLIIMVLENHLSEVKAKAILRKKKKLVKRAKVALNIDSKDMTLQEIQALRKSNVKVVMD